MILRERVQIGLVRERAFFLGLHEEVLAEIGHLFAGVLLVERDSFLERMHGHVRSGRAEIGVQIVLELVEQDVHFGFVELSERCDFDRINQHGPFVFHGVERGGEDARDALAEIIRLADDADPRSAQPGAVEKLRVVGRGLATRNLGCGIVRVNASQRAEQRRRVGNGARPWGPRCPDCARWEQFPRG